MYTILCSQSSLSAGYMHVTIPNGDLADLLTTRAPPYLSNVCLLQASCSPAKPSGIQRSAVIRHRFQSAQASFECAGCCRGSSMGAKETAAHQQPYQQPRQAQQLTTPHDYWRRLVISARTGIHLVASKGLMMAGVFQGRLKAGPLSDGTKPIQLTN